MAIFTFALIIILIILLIVGIGCWVMGNRNNNKSLKKTGIIITIILTSFVVLDIVASLAIIFVIYLNGAGV